MQHSVADHLPTTPVQSFVDDVERLLDAHARDHDPDLIVQAVQRRLTALLASADVLEPADRIPWADHYRPHLLTVAPSRRFSLLALIWAPGQVTPIHDHICWCVVGVLEGLEREQRFSLRANSDGQRWLATTTDVMVMPGEVSRLTPPEENIHQVRNAGDFAKDKAPDVVEFLADGAKKVAAQVSGSRNSSSDDSASAKPATKATSSGSKSGTKSGSGAAKPASSK